VIEVPVDGVGAGQAGCAYFTSVRVSLGTDEADRLPKPSSIAASAPSLQSSAAKHI